MVDGAQVRLRDVEFDQSAHGRKRRTYEAWRELVLRTVELQGDRRRSDERRRLARAVRDTRTYIPPSIDVRALNPSGSDTKARVIRALQAWMSESGPPYTATTYTRYRGMHRDLPTRDTVARAFGSWRAGLEAAGVPLDDARAVETVRRIAGTAEPMRKLQRAHRRAAIVDAIRACMDELGRAPRAMEFFRWRLANAPDTPTQADLYRLFEGGFPEALAGAEMGVPPVRRAALRP